MGHRHHRFAGLGDFLSGLEAPPRCRRQLDHRISGTFGAGETPNCPTQLSEYGQESARGEPSVKAFPPEYLRPAQYDPQLGLNNLQAALAQGKGILYLTGHFSAWELLPTAHALYGYPLNFITRPLDNPYLEQFVSAIRQASGNTVISKRNSARPILEKLKKGEGVGILIDQNTMAQDGILLRPFRNPGSHHDKSGPFRSPDGGPGPDRVFDSLAERTLYHKVSAAPRAVAFRRHES